MNTKLRQQEHQLSQAQANKLIAEQVARFNSTKLRAFAAETVARRAEKSPVKVTLVLCWGCNQHESDGSGYCETCRSGKETEAQAVNLRHYALTTVAALTGVVSGLVFIWLVGL